MDLDSIDGLNEIRACVYRAAAKIQALQRHMDVVSVRHVTSAIGSLSGTRQHDVGLNREEVTRALNKMFHSVPQEVAGHVTAAASAETCSLMFRLYDRTQAGRVSAASLRVGLVALSSDSLLLKYRALVSVSENSSGSVSRSGLRSVLLDLSQIPAAVQEEAVFGGVEAAVRSCFNGVLTPTVSGEHVLSWLQSEPRLLLWLPTLFRLSVSQNVTHRVRCHTCKTYPISGLRYRCMKCVNVHVCHSCFLSHRQTRKHRARHPLLEFCTQPTWKESLCLLMSSARHALLPRRYTQREADRRRVLMWAESGEAENRAPPPSDTASGMADSAVRHSPSSDRRVSHDASVQPPPCSSSSKALQTDGETPTQQSKAAALLTEVRNLHRDKWLLEQEMQAWRLTVQSEQGILEDRCSEMEITMETLRQHNVRLQGMLTQAINKMEAQQHADNTSHGVDTENTERDAHGNTEDEEEDALLKDEWHEDERQASTPTVQQGLPPSHDIHCEEEGGEEEGGSTGDRCLCHSTGQEDRPEEAGLQGEDTCLLEEEEEGEEDCGMCSSDQLLLETVERLKTVMETDRWREGQTGERKGVEFLEAADQVGDSIHHLVDAVRRDTH
ncbi:dystrotelin [Toxotes jaculatrix]|uniref:dystrotelin n=1 Tax=Toxotes jaculatrix TaxID=941984 RepID=UPI001B3AD3D0|nr:dystrotelin [Toxotes jaculatrix]